MSSISSSSTCQSSSSSVAKEFLRIHFSPSDGRSKRINSFDSLSTLSKISSETRFNETCSSSPSISPTPSPNTRSFVSISKLNLSHPNSKENLHQLFDLYQEKSRSKAIPPVIIPRLSSSMVSPLNSKGSSTLKRLSARLSCISMLSRPSLPLLRATASLPPSDVK